MNSPKNIAERLRAAYRSGPIPPLRDDLDPTDVAGAYAVQALNSRYWIDAGRRPVGRKVGLTAKAVQKQLGVDRPDYGLLFDDMLVDCGGTLTSDRLLQPKAEAEVALVLGKSLAKTDASVEDVVAVTAYATAAIEIVDSRIADWKITFADTVADNGSSAFFVLGDERKSLVGLDLWTCGMVLEINDEVVSLGVGAACLGHPLEAAAWLARTLAQQGEALNEGDVIMTGALGPMVALAGDAHVRATIAGLGSCEFFFRDTTHDTAN